MNRLRTINLGFANWSGLYLWAAFIITFGIWTPNLFLTSGTLHSVASQQAVIGILALAVLIPLSAGAYDLSVGANINLSCIVVVVLQTHTGLSPVVAIPCAVGVSLAIGIANGLVVTRLKVNSFIATLGMASLLAAFQSITSGQRQPLPPTGQGWLDLTQKEVFGFQAIVLYLLVMAVIVWWVMDHTPVGRYVYAVGGNSEAAKLAGVRTDRWTLLTLSASGLLAGIAGVLYASLYGPALTFGPALLLPAFAAVFLGSTQITPGRFNVWGTLIAVYVLATGVKGLQLVTGKQWLADLFNGVAVIAAVAFAGWRQRTVAKPRQRRPVPAQVSPDEPNLPSLEHSGPVRQGSR